MRFLSLILSLLVPFLYRCCLVSMMCFAVLIYSNLDVMVYYLFAVVFSLQLVLLLLSSFWAYYSRCLICLVEMSVSVLLTLLFVSVLLRLISACSPTKMTLVLAPILGLLSVVVLLLLLSVYYLSNDQMKIIFR